jgi:hypothetical protein
MTWRDAVFFTFLFVASTAVFAASGAGFYAPLFATLLIVTVIGANALMFWFFRNEWRGAQ